MFRFKLHGIIITYGVGYICYHGLTIIKEYSETVFSYLSISFLSVLAKLFEKLLRKKKDIKKSSRMKEDNLKPSIFI